MLRKGTAIDLVRKHAPPSRPSATPGYPWVASRAATPGAVRYINPDSLYRAVNAYTQVVVSEGAVRTIYVSGQNALDDHGRLVGKNDLNAQLDQTYRNLQIALESAGAGLEHVVKWNLYLIEGQTLGPGVSGFTRTFGEFPPAMTILFVTALAHGDYLVEMDAIAVVPIVDADAP